MTSAQPESIKERPILSARALNRATLARQLLLKRSKLSTLETLEHLVGLQAQSPIAPYYALWTRLENFQHADLSQLLLGRQAVRMALMRSTLHLVSAKDALDLRPLLQPVLDRSLKGNFGKALTELDLADLATASRTLVEERPLTFSELGKLLQERFPDRAPSALAAAARTVLPLVQVPPRGLWGESGQAMHTSAEAWLRCPLPAAAAPDETLLRYLGAFGPATIKDMQAWSGLTRVREAIERLRPLLVTFRDSQGNELFDLPDAPRPDPDTVAPPRFLGEFDQILLSHADRSRILTHDSQKRVFSENGIIRSVLLLDGFVAGLWKIARDRTSAVLNITLFDTPGAQTAALTEEGDKLLAFAAAESKSREIRITVEEMQ